MTPRRSSRAGTASQQPTQVSSQSVKTGSESPVYLSSAALVSPEEARQARQRFFDALGSGDAYPGVSRAVLSADQLTEVQLKKCFDILHACGGATSGTATLETTRASVDGFLDALFHGWTSDSADGCVRPDMEFLVEAGVVAGTICTVPGQHKDRAACKASQTCPADISAVITYNCNPAMLKMEFTMVDPFTGQPEAFCPLGRPDIRWADSDWRETLRKTLEAKLVSKVHRHNKHLAVWHARKLIREWSRGSIDMGPDVAQLGFLGQYEVSLVLTGCPRELNP